MQRFRSESTTTGPSAARAFSLIELLVSIGVIALLLAILLPALLGARSRGREVVTLGNLRQLSLTMEAYLGAYDQTYPWAPAGTWFTITPPDDLEPSSVYPGYWNLDIYWTALMHDVAPWRQNFRSWVGPGGVDDAERPWLRARGAGIPSYHLSHTFFARPEVWAPAPVDSATFYRPVSQRDVRFPSNKVMMWDEELTHLANQPKADRDLRPMLFADGHASVKRLSKAARPPAISFKPDTRPVVDTPNGVHGRDY
ncbi:MAG: prepilin-type N-terminal cleavage/methylation domain-containing protein [Phycisphaerales bacterium]|jgi:prepilin-type N-terminal cleavage/methylation domain-containing protein|nr:prepilin-type N-terminal cleavage/methylation domain-containing protein [Phycisphaerales bacterium]